MRTIPTHKALFALSLAFLSLTYIMPASASEARIELAGQVPIMCRAEIDLGGQSLAEFCNNPGGYEVYLDHEPLGAPASVTVDGATLALSGAASTLISSSHRAGARSRSIVFDLPRGSTLIVRVVPR